MPRRDVSSFIAPDCPCTERKLNEKKCDPPDRQFLERENLARVFPNARTKRNDADRNQQRDKAMCHLQPNLESIQIRQATSITPGINLRECRCACIRDPCAVCSRKIENRQIAMLMTHCRPQRKLRIN